MKTSRLAASAASTALLVVALGVSASPAGAEPTWTVTAGSAPAGKAVTITAPTVGTSPQVLLQDITSSTTLNCASDTLFGRVVVGAGQSATGVLTFPAVGVSGGVNCTGPMGLTLTTTGQKTAVFTPQRGTSNVVTGTITGVDVLIADSGSGGSQCRFNAVGSLTATYDNATQLLGFSIEQSRIRATRVSGCFGLVAENDLLGVTAQHRLTADKAAYNPITITRD